jgi:glycosyltransferase involved in cell wall biosynthesis
MISTFYPPHHFGGDATYIRALSRALVARGHEVEVIHCTDAYKTLTHSSETVNHAAEDGVTVHRLASRFGGLSPLFTQQTGHPGFKYRALKEILSRDFDVVNFHNISLVGGPSILGLSRAPVTLYTLHEHWLLCPTHIFWKNRKEACIRRQCLTCSVRSGIPPQLWRYTGLIKHSLKAVDAMLAPSLYTARKHEEAGLGKNVRVLPLFSSIDPGEPAAFSPPARPRFVYAGRVTASKGILPMLETFSKLPEVDLQVVGDGDLLALVRAKYAHCDNISFKGLVSQDNLVHLYQNATALLLPSLAPETFGLTVVEAFACATPAIVRDAGGSSALIDETGAGFVYRTDEELALHVKRLAGDSVLRSDRGHKARAGFTSLYTENHHLESYLGHIADVQRQNGLKVH